MTPGPKDAERYAEIIFRGKITGFRETGNGTRVMFSVDRVWKGQVAKKFEMPALKETTACVGFWPTLLESGNELVVYARRMNGGNGDYITDICSGTHPARPFWDLPELGFGRQPEGK